jgi:hypothetical protein
MGTFMQMSESLVSSLAAELIREEEDKEEADRRV